MEYFLLKYCVKLGVLGPYCSLFITFKEVLLSIFSRIQSNLNFEIKRWLNFNDFLWQAISETFQTWEQNIIVYTKYPSTFSYLKHLQSNSPSFRTISKPLSNKAGKIFCKGFKRMCQLFDLNGQKAI